MDITFLSVDLSKNRRFGARIDKLCLQAVAISDDTHRWF